MSEGALDVPEQVTQILTSGEEIVHVACPVKIPGKSNPAIALTNKRFIIFKKKLIGMDIEDYMWRDLKDVSYKESLTGVTVTLKMDDDEDIDLPRLPKDEARKLYSVAKEMEEKTRKEKRSLELEEKRAAAGGVVVHSPPTDAKEDPVQKLKQLKDMLDMGLVSQDEYDKTKASILSRM